LNLAVFSDTHGHCALLRQVVGGILQDRHMDLLVHLGDDYDDAEVFYEFETPYLRVPGVYSDYYVDPRVPNRRIEDFEGWRTLLTHTRESHANDPRRSIKPERLIAQNEVDIVLFGHTHRPYLAEEKGILFVNPGHLKDRDKKGHEPTCALLDIRADAVGVRVEGLDGKTLSRMEHTRKGAV
jgi:hypothetical protein